MRAATERTLQAALADGSCHIGQLAIRSGKEGFTLCHHEDDGRADLRVYRGAHEAADIARFDDAGKYRPLKTAPNLSHEWQLLVASLSELAAALDLFYPGRLAVWLAFCSDWLTTTCLRATLNRQSGMYRVAARISDEEISEVVFRVCRSDGGCLRTILWKRDATGATPSAQLPAEKFDPAKEAVPLLCQEACAILIGQCRNAVKQGNTSATAGRLNE
jgi:sirohydrochlorin cobaltochelatase